MSFHKGEIGTHIHTHGEGRGWGDASKGPANYQKRVERSPLTAPHKNRPCRHSDQGLRSCRTVTQDISVVQATLFMVLCHGRSSKGIEQVIRFRKGVQTTLRVEKRPGWPQGDKHCGGASTAVGEAAAHTQHPRGLAAPLRAPYICFGEEPPTKK